MDEWMLDFSTVVTDVQVGFGEIKQNNQIRIRAGIEP